LEGVWEAVYGNTPETIFVHTIRGKPGYLYGTKLIGDNNVPAGQVTFWFRCGDMTFKNILEGKGQVAGANHSNPSFIDAKLYWYSDDVFEVVWTGSPGIRFTRLQMVEAVKCKVD